MRKLTSIVLSLLLVFALAACGGGTESLGQILGHDIKTADVMNGPKTKAIGTYAYIEMDRSELDGLSDDQWVEIFETVDGMDYNYFSIICEDGTGAVFPGCSFTASVGKLDDTGAVVKSEKELMCPDGKLKIEKAEKTKTKKKTSKTKESVQEAEKQTEEATEKAEEAADAVAQTAQDNSGLSTEQSSALNKAEQYLSVSSFSHDSLVEQLEFEGFSNEDAVYAADNCGANWSEQALKKAGEYLNTSAFSYSGLISQLEFEKFSNEDATYAADNCGADWNEQAAKKASDYRNTSSFSHQGLVEQLEFEGFSAEQAEYGASATE